MRLWGREESPPFDGIEKEGHGAMVTDMKDNMGKVFDSVNDGFRAAMDAGRRTQESWFNAMKESWKRPEDMDRCFSQGERFAREWVPFVGKTVETTTQACDAGFRSGMDVMKAACEAATKTDESDFYKRSRPVWDAAFDAMRTQFDAMNKAAVRTMDHYTLFCEAAWGEPTTARPTCKPTAKAGA